MNLFTSIKNALRLSKATRNARNGIPCTPSMTAERTPPDVGFYDTVEGCVLYSCVRETFRAVEAIFQGMPLQTKRRLAFAPKTGEFCDRARFWQEALSSLPSRQYHEAMSAILGWYRHIKALQEAEA